MPSLMRNPTGSIPLSASAWGFFFLARCCCGCSAAEHLHLFLHFFFGKRTPSRALFSDENGSEEAFGWNENWAGRESEAILKRE